VRSQTQPDYRAQGDAQDYSDHDGASLVHRLSVSCFEADEARNFGESGLFGRTSKRQTNAAFVRASGRLAFPLHKKTHFMMKREMTRQVLLLYPGLLAGAPIRRFHSRSSVAEIVELNQQPSCN
jgi:hypothetical protein